MALTAEQRLINATKQLPSGTKKVELGAFGNITLQIKKPSRAVRAFAQRMNIGLSAAARRAPGEYTTELERSLDAAMTQLLPWPGFQGSRTQRQNGEIAGYPRNIIDTGELIDSKNLVPTANGVTIEYNTSYAAAVHWGTRSVPPRPWILLALNVDRRDISGYYLDVVEEEISKIVNAELAE